MTPGAWVAVDLDGTLAHYTGWQGATHIGPPVPAMLHRVQLWLATGTDVRIFTARAHQGHTQDGAVAAVEAWCRTHLGVALPVTCQKDYGMVQLWDDRCVQVETNTGRRMDGQPG